MTTETKEPAEPKGTRPGGRKKAKTAKTTITCDSCFYYQRLGGGSKGTCVWRGTVNRYASKDCPWYEREAKATKTTEAAKEE